MGEVVGPLSVSELRDHAQKGRVTHDTVIRKGLDGQWISADSVKGLFERDSAPPPTPTPMPPKLVSNSRGVAESNAPNIESDGVQQPVFTLKGKQDLLEVFEDRVTIKPKGVLGFLNKGMKGTKEIPFASVVAVQFREAGPWFNGYLQFTIPGGNES